MLLLSILILTNKTNACCPIGQIISVTNVSLSTAIDAWDLDPNATEGVCFFISGTLTVDVDYTLTNVEIRLNEDAIISVEPGIEFVINSSNLEGCNNYLWKEITVKGNASLRIRSSKISEAVKAINPLDNASFLLIGVIFDNNRWGIYSTAQVLGKHQINGCTFKKSGGNPNVGSATGIQLIDLSYFNIGYPAYNNYGPAEPVNKFENLKYGIFLIDSHISVHGCQFSNIQQGISYFANCSVIQTGLGAPPPFTPQFSNITPTFQNVEWCFYSASEDFIRSEYNLIKDAEVGYFNDSASPITQIEITKNSILDSRWSGITIDGSPGNVLIENNYIQTENNQDNLPSHGIYFRLQNPPISPSFIQNNEIRSFSDSGNGILINGYGPNVKDNNIGMLNTAPSPFPNSVAGIGISPAGFVSTSVIECNHIEAESINKDINGIYCNSSSSILFSCNEVENIKNGAAFKGVCTDTDFRGNSFLNHDIGLLLEESIMGFGIQEHKGNTWFGSYASNGARYEGDIDNLSSYEFDVYPFINSELMPPNPFPALGWFVPGFGNTYECPNTCDTGIDWFLSPTDEEIATGNLEPSIYKEEQKWLAARRLYRKVEDNNFIGLNTKIDSFYNANVNTSIGHFVSIEKAIEAAMKPDSNIQSQMTINRNQTIFLMDSLAMIEKALTTATGQDSLDLINTSLNLMSQVHNLVPQQDSLRSIVETTRNTDLDLIIPLNAAVFTSTTQENNIKTYNDIRLNHLLRGDKNLSSAQITSIYHIANQCPFSGGEMVYAARETYMSVLDTFIYFDDATLCTQQSNFSSPNSSSVLNTGRNSGQNQSGFEGQIAMYPNPADQSANLLVSQNQFESGIMALFDIYGKKIIDISLSNGQQKYTFDTSFLPDGIYLYKVWIDGKEVVVDKLSIISN